MLFAGFIAALYMLQFARNYYGSSMIQEGQIAAFTSYQVVMLVLYFALFQFFLAAIDFPLQWRLHADKLKMTREEMKKETKQSEGDPHLKQQRRQRGADIAKQGMLDAVKTATVVMVNPEHYAVALKWDQTSDRAPVVVAKGVDHIAARIREVAKEHNVPIYRDPPSTRSIYKLVEIDEEIQQIHFAAVARGDPVRSTYLARAILRRRRMTKTDTKLREIVRLKKRIAESEYRAVSRELESLDEKIEQMRAGIDAAQTNGEYSSGTELGAVFNFVRKQLSELQALKAARGTLVIELGAARDKLKNIILSEDVLKHDAME